MSKKNWKLEFAYLLDDNMISPTENFIIQAEINDCLFIGEAIDADFKNLADQYPDVDGVLEDEYIRFSKHYPFYFGTDDDGKLIIDRSQNGHSVVYEGEWNEQLKMYEGDWFLEWRDDAGEVYHITGPWEMKEVK